MQKTQLLIIGSGPAGYTAGIYAGRAKLAPILIGGLKSGGQLMNTGVVENFPGFKEGKNGPDLMIEMREQAAHFETQIVDTWVSAVDFSQRPFKAWTNLPDKFDPTQFEYLTPDQMKDFRQQVMTQPHGFEAESVIIATGAAAIMLGIPGEKEFFGKGIATCAVCDAAFYKDKVVYVAGGGDSAMEDTLALTKFATAVKVVHHRDSFKASKIMQERVLHHPKVEVLWNTQVVEALGDTKLTQLKLETTGQATRTVPADGLFYAIGHKPLTQLFQGQVELDAQGYVVTPQSISQLGVTMAQQALSEAGLIVYPSMTSVPGVFAAGDVVDVRYKQAITSAGQGTSAALDAEKWLEMNERS